MTATASPAPAPPAASTALAAPTAPGPIIRLDFSTVPGFEGIQRLATSLSRSTIVPVTFRGPVGSEGFCNTIVALELATRLGFPPLLVMQNLVVVEGKTGWLGAFYIALINRPGSPFKDLEWEERGRVDDFNDEEAGVRAIATRVADGKKCAGVWITWKMVTKEGWLGKKGSKWQTMPRQMFIYRSAAFWSRQWYPEATVGLPSVEELEDIRVEADFVAPTLPAAPVNRVSGESPPTPEPSPHEPLPAAPAEDRTLEPGFDPAAMGPAPAETPDAKTVDELDQALLAQDWRKAQGIINKLPAGEARTFAAEAYNQARRRAHK